MTIDCAILFQVNKPTTEKFQSIIENLVDLEIEFVLNMFEDPIEGLKSEDLMNFVKFEADKICAMFKYDKVREILRDE